MVRLNSDFVIYLDYPGKNIGVVGVIDELKLETGIFEDRLL